jgi:hypothetical protein
MTIKAQGREEVREPVLLTDQQKIEYISGMKGTDIFPDAFQNDNQFSLFRLYAKKIIELENRLSVCENVE